MKTVSIFLFIAVLFITCSKENNNGSYHLQSPGISNSVAADDTAKIPLVDLGAGTYLGYTGGLYPGGANDASGQYAADLLDASNSIVPIDKTGFPSSTGKVVFISVGASVGGHMMKALITKTTNNPATNPKLLLINCNQGAGYASLNNIMNPKDPYWDRLDHTITKKSSYQQVQVIYIETDDSTTTVFPVKPINIKNNIDSCLRVFKQKFPNVKMVYVLGRTRTFPNVKKWNKEPGPYYFGWGCKWAIEDQINGVPGTEYKGSNAVAPMITWGFYEWADSLPRVTDNFYWRFSETKDGLHANDAGQDTLTTRFQNFLLTDPYASIWYANHP